MRYKLLFAGLGSIGRRHLQNTAAFLRGRGDEFECDALRRQGGELPPELAGLISHSYSYDDVLPRDYDVLFVTNPTARHYDTLRRYGENARHLFIEKPVFDSAARDLAALPPAGGVRYVACPLRYNAVLQYVREHIDCPSAVAVRSISSSYLPDWRPGQDYRSTYSAHRDQGGGVGIDLIHEWDYLAWLFGMPETVSCICGQHSALDLDSDDIAVYIAKRGRLTYELHLDYFGRRTLRQLQIFLPEETVEADIAKGEVRYLVSGRTVDLHEERNAYQTRELAHFFDMVEGRCANDNDLAEALAVLKIAEGHTA